MGLVGFRPDGPLHGGGDFPDHRQSQAAAGGHMAPGPVRPVKTFEDPVQLLRSHAGTVICQFQPDLVFSLGLQGDGQGTGFLRFVFPAVAQQVLQHPGKLVPVHPDGGCCEGGGKGEMEAVLLPVLPLFST